MAVDWAASYDTCSFIMTYIEKVSGSVQFDDAGEFAYDARIFGYDWDPSE